MYVRAAQRGRGYSSCSLRVVLDRILINCFNTGLLVLDFVGFFIRVRGVGCGSQGRGGAKWDKSPFQERKLSTERVEFMMCDAR